MFDRPSIGIHHFYRHKRVEFGQRSGSQVPELQTLRGPQRRLAAHFHLARCWHTSGTCGPAMSKPTWNGVYRSQNSHPRLLPMPHRE